MPRKRGRPALSPNDRSIDVHLKLPSRMYDQTYAIAAQLRMTVPKVIRIAISRLLRDERNGSI